MSKLLSRDLAYLLPRDCFFSGIEALTTVPCSEELTTTLPPNCRILS